MVQRLTHERAKGQETRVHLPQQLPLLLRIVLRVPLPEIHPRLPWRSLRCLYWRNHIGIEFACPVDNSRTLIVRLGAGHVRVSMYDCGASRYNFGAIQAALIWGPSFLGNWHWFINLKAGWTCSSRIVAT